MEGTFETEWEQLGADGQNVMLAKRKIGFLWIGRLGRHASSTAIVILGCFDLIHLSQNYCNNKSFPMRDNCHWPTVGQLQIDIRNDCALHTLVGIWSVVSWQNWITNQQIIWGNCPGQSTSWLSKRLAASGIQGGLATGHRSLVSPNPQAINGKNAQPITPL